MRPIHKYYLLIQHIIASVVGLTARMNNTELAVVIQALQNKLRTLAADSPIEVPIKLEGQSDHKSKQRNHKSKQGNDKSKHIEVSRFTSKQDRLQYQHKAMVARCFCDRDYGSKHLYEMMQSTNNNLNMYIFVNVAPSTDTMPWHHQLPSALTADSRCSCSKSLDC